MLFPGSQYNPLGETSPKAIDTKLFSSHINSPVPANFMIPLKKLEGFLKGIFSIGFELRLVCIRNYFKALTEPKGFLFFKRELHKSRFCLLPCYFLPHLLASAKHVFSSLSKGEKLHFHSVVQTNKAVLCIFPDHQARRKISGTPLRTPRVVMFPVVPAAVYRAGFHLLLFWHTLVLSWLAQQHLAIVPCLRGISSWIRIQSLCAVNLLNYVVKEMLFCP